MQRVGLMVFAISAVLVAGFSSGMIQPALSAQKKSLKKSYSYVINLADQQRTLSQQMSKQAILIALNVSRSENLRKLQRNRALFGQILRGLRHGDIDLALAGTASPEILHELEKVELIWPAFEAALQQAASADQVTANHIAAITRTNTPVLKALDAVVRQYGHVAAKGKLFSLLDLTVDRCGYLRTLSQKISKELLLVTYGQDLDQNRAKLSASLTEFNRILNAVSDGDPELVLMRSPTPEIRAQLESVQEVWNQLQPIARRVADGNQIDAAAIEEVEQLNLTLLSKTNRAVHMYGAL